MDNTAQDLDALTIRLANAKPGEIVHATPDEITRLRPSDPAPDPVESARKRAADFVTNISTNTKLELGRRRDELDTAMERITNSEKALHRYIGEFARFNYEALEHAKVVGKAIAELATPFKADPPATITQLKNGDSK